MGKKLSSKATKAERKKKRKEGKKWSETIKKYLKTNFKMKRKYETLCLVMVRL